MTQKNIVFVPESGSEIGMGHVFRLLSFAQILERDYPVRFLVQNDQTAAIVQNSGYKCTVSPFDESALLKQFRPGEIVVADGYHFDSHLFLSLRSAGIQSIYLDDFAENLPPADIILNTADLENSPENLPFFSQFASGHQYILLRKAFLNARHSRPDLQMPPQNVFVCLGATDPLGLTLPLVHRFSELFPDAHYTILSSSMNQHLPELATILRVTLLQNADSEEIANALKKSDLAIVSASNIAQECIAIGIPLACIQTADNQEKLYSSLVSNQLCFALGNQQNLPNSLSTLHLKIDDQSYWKQQLVNQSDWIDGNSGLRVKKLIDSLNLTIRSVAKDDSELLLTWKNDPVSLENSFNSAPVERNEHEHWFGAELHNPNAAMYLICLNDNPVSLVRFKRYDQKAVIGITVAPEYRGFKFAPRSLVLACNTYAEEQGAITIEAYIKEDNEASIHSFEAAGFRFRSKTEVDAIPALLLTKTSKRIELIQDEYC